MASGYTQGDGCATLYYKSQSWDGIGGRSPDIYCVVSKDTFVDAVPLDKDHHDQNTLADFGLVDLYRDRRGDYGHDNGCGPAWSEWSGINDLAAWALRFGEQCTHHDKCYWDCQIFDAEGQDAEKAQKFCDDEMLAGMKSWCNLNRGNLPGVAEDLCHARANSVYMTLRTVGGWVAYDRSVANCPSSDPSYRNDYGNHPDSECLPSGTKCGSTLVTNNFNKCDQCCGGFRTDDGWTYDDHFCL